MKVFETPEITIEHFDTIDILTISTPKGTQIWEGYDGYTEPGDGGVEADNDFDW